MTHLAPLDETISLHDMDRDPFPIYRRLRAQAPVVRVKSVGRTLLTRAADTKYIKDHPELFSSDDHNTPMNTPPWPPLASSGMHPNLWDGAVRRWRWRALLAR